MFGGGAIRGLRRNRAGSFRQFAISNSNRVNITLLIYDKKQRFVAAGGQLSHSLNHFITKVNMSNPATFGHFDQVIAGASAGLLESLITYPTEYVKTRQQLASSGYRRPQSMAAVLAHTFRNGRALRTLYSGASSFCISNAAKSGVRFFVFDKTRSLMPRDHETGKWSSSSNLVAGLVAGVAESVLVVTPGETLKTRIIENRQQPRNQQFNGVADGISRILRIEGPSGLYRGVVPVTMKQSSNAMVRFTSYNVFLDMLDGASAGRFEGTKPILAGAFAGTVTVYVTMPFDSVKTRLQVASSRNVSTGTISCVMSMIRNEGVSSLWRGTTPRLLRLTVSAHRLCSGGRMFADDDILRCPGLYPFRCTRIQLGSWN